MKLTNEEDAITQAVQAGYLDYSDRFPAGLCEVRVGWSICARYYRQNGKPGTKFWQIGRVSDALLDPAFWQALQNAICDPPKTSRTYWKVMARKWFETRLSGGDLEAFWQSLP
jgi:hypothetical protein